jgi:hypothetical protein
VWQIEVMHGSFFPDDEPGALGMVFGIDNDDDQRVTLIVDPEWLRMLIDGIENGHDVGLVEVPASVSLPIALQGWDEEWGDEELAEAGHMHWLFRTAGWDWPLLKRVIDLLEGFEQQTD